MSPKRVPTSAAATIVVWIVSVPFFGWFDTWQLVINTGTTIVTCLRMLLIQNTQNRDSEAMHLKLDELICAMEQADNSLLDMEELGEAELDQRRDAYGKLAQLARAGLQTRPEER